MRAISAIVRRLRVLIPLTAALAVLLAWPASYLFEFRGSAALVYQVRVNNGPGWFAVTVGRAAPDGRRFHWSLSTPSDERRHELAFPRVYSAPGDYHFFTPFWVAELTAALAAGAIVATRRLALRSPGLCRQCGYDLRASPDRCPECGTSVIRT